MLVIRLLENRKYWENRAFLLKFKTENKLSDWLRLLDCLLRLYFYLDLFSCQLAMRPTWKKSCIAFFLYSKISWYKSMPLAFNQKIIPEQPKPRQHTGSVLWYLWIKKLGANLRTYLLQDMKHFKKT